MLIWRTKVPTSLAICSFELNDQKKVFKKKKEGVFGGYISRCERVLLGSLLFVFFPAVHEFALIVSHSSEILFVVGFVDPCFSLVCITLFPRRIVINRGDPNQLECHLP